MLVLLESSVALVLFYTLYLLWLRRETFFKGNRYYLLLSALVSVWLPWLSIPWHTGTQNQVYVYNLLDTVTITAAGYEAKIMHVFAAGRWLFYIYLAGVLVQLLRFLLKYLKIVWLQQQALVPPAGQYPANVHFLSGDTSSFSFFRQIYVNATDLREEEIQSIIRHERVHVSQIHSVDSLFYELLIAFFWFNPIVYRYRKSAQTIHEYLADEGALCSGESLQQYQQLLFEQASGLKGVHLAHNFNYSLTKKRLIMLTKVKSAQWRKIRFFGILPAFLILLLSFACNQISDQGALKSEIVAVEQTDSDVEQVFTEVDEMPVFPEGMLGLRKYIAQQVKYPEAARNAGTEGKVFIQFVVNSQGEVTQVKHVGTRLPEYTTNEVGEVVVVGYGKSPDADDSAYDVLVQEAIRVVQSLPNWTPGQVDGKAVNVEFTLPINFALQ